MPARLFLRPQPRAFFLLTDTHALVFRQPGAEESKAARSVVVAEFLPIDEVDTAGLIPCGVSRSVEGVLGVTSVPTDRSPIPDVFLLVLTSSSPLPSLIPGSSLRPARVVSVDFYSLTTNFWDPPTLTANQLGGLGGLDDFEDDTPDYYRTDSRATHLSQAQQQGVEDPCAGMRKYLESGGFFHAVGCQWDISRHVGCEGTNLVADQEGRGRSALEDFDERFVWNAHLLHPLLLFRKNLPDNLRAELDAHALLLPVIQGFVGSVPLGAGSWSSDDSGLSGLALVSRLSCKRAGARFRTRGIDDDGNVANFVETEVILTTGGVCESYVQVRGSVPLFWQQPQQGFGTLQQKVEITRPPQATQPAFDKHFLDLTEHYGGVHAVNLMGQRDAESMLSGAYSDRFQAMRSSALGQAVGSDDDETSPPAMTYTPYDFHSVVRLGGHEAVRSELSTMADITYSLNQFGYTAVDLSTGEVIAPQTGVFRTNCLDCLDRTNFVQEVLSSIALRRFLSSNGSALINSPTLWSAHRELWADNGDRLSKTYAGTGALNTSATRSGRKTFAGLLSDATKSVGRAYINNFQDKHKQAAIDLLLGLMAGQRSVVLFDPVSDSVQSALAARMSEYSSPRNLVLYSGTWNVNGKLPDAPLDPWLFPDGAKADIYAIAFQEIVELTPQQIVQPDPAKKKIWENKIMDTFAGHSDKHSYIMLRSEQLVGTALMIVVRESLLPAIRRIEYASKKTGLQGLSGNKGGIGFRFDLFDASVCLMTCHLAAGQSSYADRNADYRTISNGLAFLRGKTIDSHDIVVWAADFNYRIDLPNDEVREYAAADELDALIAADQLGLARDDLEVFVGYKEGPLTFRPTYKYDNGTDVYDTSEKQRIPSWTDRVLYKGDGLHLRAYNCAQLLTSDHRPVYAMFEATVPEIDQAKRSAIAKQLTAKARAATSGAKFDDKVEKAAQGGVRGLVKEFTSVSIAPSPTRSTSSTPEPKIPPAFSRDSKPKPKPRAQPTSLAQTVNSAYARLGQPPPLPPRNGVTPSSTPASPVTTAGSAAVPYEPRRRHPPPPPASSDFKKIGLPPDELTPVATGDFVLVPSPQRPPAPPLPARKGSTASVATVASTAPSTATSTAASTAPSSTAPPLPPRIPPRPGKQGTLDFDSPPPDGLAAPALPDNVSKKPPGVPDSAKPDVPDKASKKPPALASKPPLAPKPKSQSSTDDAAEAEAKPVSVKDAIAKWGQSKPAESTLAKASDSTLVDVKAPLDKPSDTQSKDAKPTAADNATDTFPEAKKAPPPLAPKPARKPSVGASPALSKAPPPVAPKPTELKTTVTPESPTASASLPPPLSPTKAKPPLAPKPSELKGKPVQ